MPHRVLIGIPCFDFWFGADDFLVKLLNMTNESNLQNVMTSDKMCRRAWLRVHWFNLQLCRNLFWKLFWEVNRKAFGPPLKKLFIPFKHIISIICWENSKFSYRKIISTVSWGLQIIGNSCAVRWILASKE